MTTKRRMGNGGFSPLSATFGKKSEGNEIEQSGANFYKILASSPTKRNFPMLGAKIVIQA